MKEYTFAAKEAPLYSAFCKTLIPFSCLLTYVICSKIGGKIFKKLPFHQWFLQSIIIMNMLKPEGYDTTYHRPLVRTKFFNHRKYLSTGLRSFTPETNNNSKAAQTIQLKNCI